MTITIVHVPEQQRFEARDDLELGGFVEYIRTDAGLIVYTHTEVAGAYEGKGVGSALARHVLDYARHEQLEVLPLCPFISGWIQRHPEYQDLVYRPKPSSVTD